MDGQRDSWMRVSHRPLKGSPWLRTETCHYQAPSGSASPSGLGRVPEDQGVWAESSQNAFCGSAFWGVGDQSLSSHGRSACQNKNLWFCVVAVFYKNVLCS